MPYRGLVLSAKKEEGGTATVTMTSSQAVGYGATTATIKRGQDDARFSAPFSSCRLKQHRRPLYLLRGEQKRETRSDNASICKRGSEMIRYKSLEPVKYGGYFLNETDSENTTSGACDSQVDGVKRRLRRWSTPKSLDDFRWCTQELRELGSSPSGCMKYFVQI